MLSNDFRTNQIWKKFELIWRRSPYTLNSFLKKLNNMLRQPDDGNNNQNNGNRLF